MSLVSNFIGDISSIGLNNGVSSTPSFDLNDTTFAELLEKQLNKNSEVQNSSTNLIDGLGMPPGIQIENFDGIDFSETAQDQVEAVGEKINTTETDNMTNPFDMNNDGDVTTSEVVTFFSSLLDNNSQGQNARSELFDFAKKQATNFYNTYSRSVVTDLKEFVDDIQDKIS